MAIDILMKAWLAPLGAFGPQVSAVVLLAVECLLLYWMYRWKIFLTP
jgi:hypothetical protein